MADTQTIRLAEIVSKHELDIYDEWISLQGSWHASAWRPEIVARRIIAWLAQATLILNDAEDKVIESIAGKAGGVDLVLSAVTFSLAAPGRE